MRVVTDKSFAGEEGMIRVWNATAGFLQVSEEGHLLQPQVSAWVDDNDTVRSHIESGMLVALGGTPKKSPKKSTKAKPQEVAPSPSDTSQDQVAVQDLEESRTTETNTEENNNHPTEEQALPLDSMILDSSELSDSTDSVSAENI